MTTSPVLKQSLPSPSKPRGTRTIGKIGLRFAFVLISLAAGLAVAEHFFDNRDGGAFPHLNIYETDKILGVRLQPHARQRLRFGNNPFFNVRTNAYGFRGADRPIEENSILVVGDSQVLGLGVEEHETFAAQLEKLTKRQVINAGVPTYGPEEYTALMGQLLPKFKSTTVIYLVNIGNDYLESLRPNIARHKVWDGWAARIETAPESTIWFPGRDWVMGRSHFFLALRRYLHTSTPDELSTRMPSEGTWEELVTQGSSIDQRIEEAAIKLPYDARDVVGFSRNSESAGPSAHQLIRVASVRLKDEYAAKVAHRESPIFKHLEQAAKVAKTNGADLIIATLPLDVQVSETFWRGYSTPKIDMAPSLSLLEEVTEIAFEVGASGINLIHPNYDRSAGLVQAGVLAKPEPLVLNDKSFLEGDLHLNPYGHFVVAKLIDAYMTKPLTCRCLDLQYACDQVKSIVPQCFKLKTNNCAEQIECAEKFGVKQKPKPRRRR